MPDHGAGRHSILPIARFASGSRRCCWTACCCGARRPQAIHKRDPGGRCFAMISTIGPLREPTRCVDLRLPVCRFSLLPGCSDLRAALGMDRAGPDEFAVESRAPLLIPPDFDLRPPQPGAPRPQEVPPPNAPARSSTPPGRASRASRRPRRFEVTRGRHPRRPQIDPNQQVQDNSMASRLLGSADSTAPDGREPRNQGAEGGLLRRIGAIKNLPPMPAPSFFGYLVSRHPGLMLLLALAIPEGRPGAAIRGRKLHPRQRHPGRRAAEPSGPGGDPDGLVQGRRRRRPARQVRYRAFSRTSDVQGHEADPPGEFSTA